MTDDKKALARDQPVGFRITESGDVEVLSEAEVDAAINHVIREALKQFRVRTSLH
jgi:hypothetical protein